MRDIRAGQGGDSRDQRSGVDRFGQVELETRLERFLPILLASEGGQRGGRYGGDCGIKRSEFAHQRIAVFARHGNVCEQDMHRTLLQHFERFRRRPGRQDRGVTTLEVRRDHVPTFLVVVHNQHRQTAQ